jgi:hypothetical protein
MITYDLGGDADDTEAMDLMESMMMAIELRHLIEI